MGGGGRAPEDGRGASWPSFPPVTLLAHSTQALPALSSQHPLCYGSNREQEVKIAAQREVATNLGAQIHAECKLRLQPALTHGLPRFVPSQSPEIGLKVPPTFSFPHTGP